MSHKFDFCHELTRLAKFMDLVCDLDTWLSSGMLFYSSQIGLMLIVLMKCKSETCRLISQSSARGPSNDLVRFANL